MAKLPGPKMIPGAEGVQRSVELAARQQYLRSWKQVKQRNRSKVDHSKSFVEWFFSNHALTYAVQLHFSVLLALPSVLTYRCAFID